MRRQLLSDRLAHFVDDRFRLDQGSHESFEVGHCATEAAAWLSGESHTDRPQCMSSIVAQFLRTFNDRSSDERRQALKPYILRALHTAGDGRDQQREALSRTWLVRCGLPPALEVAGCSETAARLRALPDSRAAKRTAALLRQAREEVWSARDRGYRSLGDRGAAAYAAGAATAGDAAGAAAAASAAFALEAAAVHYHFASYADAPPYADAPTAAAATAFATYADAAAVSAYADYPGSAALGSTPAESRALGRRAAAAKLRPLAEAIHREALELLDRMLPS
jgi:hypothetical protein